MPSRLTAIALVTLLSLHLTYAFLTSYKTYSWSYLKKYHESILEECCKIRPKYSILSFHRSTKRERIIMYQMGPDYLNNLSSNEEEEEVNLNYDPNVDVDYNQNYGPLKNVQSVFETATSSVSNEVGKRTSKISSGFASVAERGSSDFQSLANNVGSMAQQSSRNVQQTTSGITSGFASVAERGSSDFQSLANNVGSMAQQSSRNVQQTAMQAQQAVKRSADGALNFVKPGKDISNLHFFELPSFSTFSPIVKADEVAQWIDSQAKSGTNIVSSKAKTLVLNFTGKNEYQFGDVTKELVHRVSSADINMQDFILVLKIMIALGATIGPMADLLPFTFLIEAVNFSLEQKVGGKILEALSKTLDNRLVAALFTADDKDLLGGVVKKTVLKGVLEFTGEKDYQAGDIQRTLQDQNNNMETKMLDLDVSAEFEEWDRMFVEKIETEEYLDENAKIMDMKIAQAMEECERISQTK